MDKGQLSSIKMVHCWKFKLFKKKSHLLHVTCTSINVLPNLFEQNYFLIIDLHLHVKLQIPMDEHVSDPNNCFLNIILNDFSNCTFL